MFYPLKRRQPVGIAVVLLMAIVLTLAILAGGCTTTPGSTSAQTALNTTAQACQANTAAITAANQAVLSGTLKGNDARNVLKGLEAAQIGCTTALATYQAAAAAAAASGAKP